MSRCDICWGLEIQEVFVAVINYMESCFSLVLLNKGRAGLLCKGTETQRGHAGKGDFPRAGCLLCPGVPGGMIMSFNGFSARRPWS